MSKSMLLKMSHLPEQQVSKLSKKRAIFCGAVNTALGALACSYLLMMRRVFIKDIEVHGGSVFPSSIMIGVLIAILWQGIAYHGGGDLGVNAIRIYAHRPVARDEAGGDQQAPAGPSLGVALGCDTQAIRPGALMRQGIADHGGGDLGVHA